jgi:hypothetical protein
MTISILRVIFWIFVLVLALSFFGISIQAIITSPAGKANFAYIYQLLTEVWQWITSSIRPILSKVTP